MATSTIVDFAWDLYRRVQALPKPGNCPWGKTQHTPYSLGCPLISFRLLKCPICRARSHIIHTVVVAFAISLRPSGLQTDMQITLAKRVSLTYRGFTSCIDRRGVLRGNILWPHLLNVLHVSYCSTLEYTAKHAGYPTIPCG